MAIWSSVGFTTAWKEQRFDPEFWQPIYLEDQEAARGWPVLGNYLVSTQYGLSREMNDSGRGTPIFRMDEMDDLFLTRPEKYAEATEEEQTSLLLKKNDVLFNRTNSTKFVGRTGILKENVHAIFASYLIRLVPDTSQLLPEYLAVYLNCPTGIRYVKRRAKESINQTNISGSEIRKVPIVIPSKNFQKQIAVLIEEAANYRSKITRLYADAEAEMLERLGWAKLANSTPDRWYVENYKNVTAATRCDAEFFQPHYERLRKYLAKSGAKPICEFCGPPVRGVQPEYVDDGPVAVVTSKHLGPTQIDMANLDRATAEFYESEDARKARLQKNDVLLYATGAYVGRTNAWLDNQPALASNHVTIIRPNPLVCHPVYLASFLNSPPGLAQSEQFASGSTQRELYPSEIKKTLVFLPTDGNGKIDLKWQQRLADKIIAASEAKVKARAKLEEAKALVEREIEKRLK